jgi:RNA polymerase sigma-70 factor, ECF subfamily
MAVVFWIAPPFEDDPDHIDVALTPPQHRITTALLVDEVPIDILAQRLGSNRNALCKTVHDARTRLRAHLIASGHLATENPQAGTS